MSEIKYTNDGKKVIVVGKLNSQDTIVQEIFVSNGNEIPSGENFIVKSLHDSPAVSWKEKNIKDLEERYDKEKKYWEDKLKENSLRYNNKVKELQLRLNYLSDLIPNLKPEAFETFADVVSGRIQYAVCSVWCGCEIKPFDDSILYIENDYGDKRVVDLKLLTIFGSSKGDLSYRISQYKDGSGSNENIYLFKDYNSALEKAKDILVNYEFYSEHTIKCAKKLNIDLDPVKLKEYYDKTRRNIQITLKTKEDEIQQLKKSLEDIVE